MVQMAQDANGMAIPCLAPVNGSAMQRNLVANAASVRVDLMGVQVFSLYSDGDFFFKVGDENVTCTASDYDCMHPGNTLYDYKANGKFVAFFATAAVKVYPHGMI